MAPQTRALTVPERPQVVQMISRMRLVTLTDRGDVMVLMVETDDGRLTHFALPKRDVPAMLKSLSIDAAALASDMPPPRSNGAVN